MARKKKKKKKSTRPAKHQNPLARIRERFSEGRYRDTRHASDRKSERTITLPEIRQVITGGYHEKRKDEYKPEHKAWNYAVRGKTVDEKDLRIAVSFDEEDSLLIITAIDTELDD